MGVDTMLPSLDTGQLECGDVCTQKKENRSGCLLQAAGAVQESVLSSHICVPLFYSGRLEVDVEFLGVLKGSMGGISFHVLDIYSLSAAASRSQHLLHNRLPLFADPVCHCSLVRGRASLMPPRVCAALSHSATLEVSESPVHLPWPRQCWKRPRT